MVVDVVVQEGRMKRILVTGSQVWADWGTLATEMREAVLELGPSALMHGDCRRGADRMANEWWIRNMPGHPVARYPADWTAPCRDTCRPGHRRPTARGSICPAAGMYRNADMVNLGPDLCLAFIHNASRGSSHCAYLAEEAGITTRRLHPAGALAEDRP